MRNIAILFAATLVVLLSVDAVLAQEMAPPMLRSIPSPTPVEESTPTPQKHPVAPPPAETPSVQPSPPKVPEASPRAEPAATPRESVRKEKPVPSVGSRRRALDVEPVRAVEPREPIIRKMPARSKKGPRAFQPTFDLSESNWATAATIRSLENRWQAAIKNHDVATLDALLADDLEATSLTGEKGGKATLLNALRKDKNVYKSVKARGMSVSNAGPDKAIVTGIATETGITADGKSFKTSRRFTDTWKQRKGKWECVASTATEVPKE